MIIWFGSTMTNSHEWIDRIIARLFEAEDRYLDRLISDLNQLNSEAKKKRFQGFIHMGKKFIPKEFLWNRQRLARQLLPTLDFSLMEKSSELTKHFSQVELDKSQIRQALFQLLCQCNTLQEIRDVLPDCLVPLVPELTGLDRFIQDPMYMVRSNRFFVNQYQRVLPKIEFYAMSRLMY